MRIAQGQWDWPESAFSPDSLDDQAPLCGPTLVNSPDAKRMVTRLLVRDPKKRAKIAELWGDEWMVPALAPPTSMSPSAVGVGSLHDTTPSSSQANLTKSAVAALPVGSGLGLSLGLETGLGQAPPTPPPSAGGKTPPGVEERLDHDGSYVDLDPHAPYVEQEQEHDADSFPEDQGVLVDREGIDGIACSEVV